MQKYALLISYDGTSFCGWQSQKKLGVHDVDSIQSTIETHLSKITGEKATVVGSGRTDSGVHALGQVGHFVLKEKEWDTGILFRALNGVLPTSIRIRAVKKVPIEFHAQRHAVKKQYSFYFQQGACPLPHLSRYSWWIRKPLNVEAMNEAFQAMRGVHDFKPFQASGAKPGPTVREIFETEVVRQPLSFPGAATAAGGLLADENSSLVRVRVMGSGFLKQMVRGIAGTLLEIGDERRSEATFREILEQQDRKLVGATAPARALWLEKVWYDDLDFSFQQD